MVRNRGRGEGINGPRRAHGKGNPEYGATQAQRKRRGGVTALFERAVYTANEGGTTDKKIDLSFGMREIHAEGQIFFTDKRADKTRKERTDKNERNRDRQRVNSRS